MSKPTLPDMSTKEFDDMKRQKDAILKPTPQTFEEALRLLLCANTASLQLRVDDLRAAHQRELAEARRETWREALDFLISQPCPEWIGQTVIEEFERRTGEK